MNAVQIKNKSRIDVGALVMTANGSIWVDDLNIAIVNELFQTTSQQMEIDNIIQTTKISGKTSTKVLNGIIMGAQGNLNEKICQQFAKDTLHDDDLFKEMSESLSNLSVGGEAKLIARNMIVFNACTLHLAAMIAAGYLISEAMITTHGTYISNFRTSVPSWKTASGLKVAATLRQKANNENIVQNLIPDMIRLLLPYKAAHLGFYNQMLNGMKPVTVGTKKNNLQALIVDADTMIPIGNGTGTLTVGIKITEQKSIKKYYLTFQSTGNGNGVLGVVVPGYIPQTVRGLGLFADKLLRIVVKMVLIPTEESIAAAKKKKGSEKIKVKSEKTGKPSAKKE